MASPFRLRRVSVPAAILLTLALVVAVLGSLLVKVWRLARADALCNAAYQGDVLEVQRLLRAGVDPNELNALGYAKWGGHTEVIVLLERAGAKDKVPWVSCAPRPR
ncbi:MAG TPA: ankyrin repeat domain-containing protein [Chthonomonadaceae bacterium]|nr:ankyrin repeat domain-containing protein [Chthonomonadaceae bacterium]